MQSLNPEPGRCPHCRQLNLLTVSICAGCRHPLLSLPIARATGLAVSIPRLVGAAFLVCLLALGAVAYKSTPNPSLSTDAQAPLILPIAAKQHSRQQVQEPRFKVAYDTSKADAADLELRQRERELIAQEAKLQRQQRQQELMAKAAQQRASAPRYCEIHGEVLKKDTVPVRHGLPDAEPHIAQQRLFPYAQTYVNMGCVVLPDDPTSAIVLYCQQCRDAESKWYADYRRMQRERLLKRMSPT